MLSDRLHGNGGERTGLSGGFYVSVPFVSGCPPASGSLSALLRLRGVTRTQVGDAFARSSSSGQEYEDFFCLTPVGILVGYPPPTLLGALPAAQRGRLAGRVEWISTSNAFYAVLGVRPGMTVAAARGLVRLIGPFHVGSNVWYLAQDGSYLAVVVVRRGSLCRLGSATGR